MGFDRPLSWREAWMRHVCDYEGNDAHRVNQGNDHKCFSCVHLSVGSADVLPCNTALDFRASATYITVQPTLLHIL